MRVGILTAAYDARVDGRKAFLSAGGFVSPIVDWTDFDGKWRDRLAQAGLSYFRMADFSHSIGDFEPLGKQKERKRGLLVDLLGIISRNKAYHSWDTEVHGIHSSFGPIGFERCLSSFATSIMIWACISKYAAASALTLGSDAVILRMRSFTSSGMSALRMNANTSMGLPSFHVLTSAKI